MKRFRVRRLPVIDVNGILKGVISINDIVLATERGAGPDAKEKEQGCLVAASLSTPVRMEPEIRES